MTTTAVQFYDGRTSAPCEARLHVEPGGTFRVELASGERRYAIAESRIHDRVGAQAPRSIEFPDGAVAHVPPDAALDQHLDALHGTRQAGRLRRLESRWPLVLGALALSAALLAGFVFLALPALAALISERVPHRFEAEIGARALAQLDDDWLGPSQLPAGRQRELADAFRQRIATQVGHPGLALEFRAGRRVGPNALALPGGVIVLTDGLVELAAHDDELLAVMAHETGHVLGRHGLKAILEGLGVTLVVTVVTGDLSGPASLAVAVPAVLLHAGYSRRYEREADAWALAWADANGVARTRLVDLLERIESAQGSSPLPGLLSTHPETAERARAAASQER